MTELLVGTKKGLFALQGDNGTFEITARAFAGEPCEFAIRDERSGRYLACVTSAFYGPKIFVTDDPRASGSRRRASRCPRAGRRRSSGSGRSSPARRTASSTPAERRACSSRAGTAG